MFVGCYKKNHEDRAIHAITDDILDGHPSSALNKKEYVIEKCAHRARQKGLLFFGIHNGDECSLSSRAQNTYDLYGSAVDCYKNGTGGVSSNAVYTFSDQGKQTGKSSLKTLRRCEHNLAISTQKPVVKLHFSKFVFLHCNTKNICFMNI